MEELLKANQIMSDVTKGRFIFLMSRPADLLSEF